MTKENSTYNIDLFRVHPFTYSCNGTASFIAVDAPDQLVPLVVVDNQRHITGGMTQSLEGTATGAEKIFVPAVYANYYGWNSSINILKLTPGNVTATITFSNGRITSCDLMDTYPGCVKYVPSFVPLGTYYAATISTNALPNENKYITAVVNAATSTQAQTYTAINDGISTKTVSLPSLYKNKWGWRSSFTCQNVGPVPTRIHIYYDGRVKTSDYPVATYRYEYPDYIHPTELHPGKSFEVLVYSEPDLSNEWWGGATIKATSSDEEARIACIVNQTNVYTLQYPNSGDWSMSYNGTSQ